VAFELQDHLVDGGGGHAEERLHVGLGRRSSVERGVRVDEGQVLALQGCVPRRRRVLSEFARHVGQFMRRRERACPRIAQRRSSGRAAPRHDSNVG
jgi:hypothetical protein